MFSNPFLSLLAVCTLLPQILVTAAPNPPHLVPSGQRIGLTRRSVNRTPEEWQSWAQRQKDSLVSKYGGSDGGINRRSVGQNLLTNQKSDSSFFGSIAVGTPPASYEVILDTGSSDLWLAASNCGDCSGIPTFNGAQSSTFANSSDPFSIVYGSGHASGTLAQDVVQMAGFTVQKQVFAICDDIASGLIDAPVSGLMGLAFQSLASSGAVPFWQALVEGGGWDQPLMGFQLTRFLNQSNARDLEPGGTFTMGATDTSLYTGDIDYVNIPSGAVGFWILEMKTLAVQGNTVQIGSGTSAYAAIDTGTTLVAGPQEIIASIYSQIPGAAPAPSDFPEGYYVYPCDTAVTISISFGSRTWSVSPTDFAVTQVGSGFCLGAFFDNPNTNPPWIVGDTFLKNVYSVFRYDPPSVGFAELSNQALKMNSPGGNLPTPTIGSATFEATGTGGQTRNGGVRLTSFDNQLVLLAGTISVLCSLF